MATDGACAGIRTWLIAGTVESAGLIGSVALGVGTAFAVAERGNRNALADTVAAAALARAATDGAYAMLRVNLPGLADHAAARAKRA